MFSEQIAIKLEKVAKKALNINHANGMGGTITAEYIEKERGAFPVICATLAPFYLNATKEEREPLDDIIERYKSMQNCGAEEYYKLVDQATEELTTLFSTLGIFEAE